MAGFNPNFDKKTKNLSRKKIILKTPVLGKIANLLFSHFLNRNEMGSENTDEVFFYKLKYIYNELYSLLDVQRDKLYKFNFLKEKRNIKSNKKNMSNKNNNKKSLEEEIRFKLLEYDITNDKKLDLIDILAQNLVILSIWQILRRKSNDYSSKFINIILKFTEEDNSEKAQKLGHLIKQLSTQQSLPRLIKKIPPTLQGSALFLRIVYGKFIVEIKKKFQQDRGIVYTPPFIIRYIFKHLHYLIKDRFNMHNGIFSQSLQLFDPAVGSLSFECELLNYAIKSRKDVKSWYENVFMKIFAGNEINPAGYIIGQYILLDCLRDFGFSPNSFNINIFNLNKNISYKTTLSEWNKERILNICRDIGKNHGGRIPTVIFGNPPYAVSSSNRNKWIHTLMKEYSVNEPNITRIYDDYVKFIRFAHKLIEENGIGIIALITNRKYLDGKIFYGMRKSLLSFFDEIYIIDLFGDSRNIKGSNLGDNIFKIQTGVAISIFIKFAKSLEAEKRDKNRIEVERNDKDYIPDHQDPNLGSINYFPLNKKKNEIEKELNTPIEEINFLRVTPHPPKYLFVPLKSSQKIINLWDIQGIPINKVFNNTSRALISSRDRFMINIDEKRLYENIDLLKERNYSLLRERKRLKTNYDNLLENESIFEKFDFDLMKENIVPIVYRPFDNRSVIYYTINKRCGKSIILDNLLQENRSRIKFEHLFSDLHVPTSEPLLKIIGPLKKFKNWDILAFNFVQSVQKPPYNHFFLTKGIVDSGMFGYSTSKVAPLIIEDEINLSKPFIDKIRQKYGGATPIEIFGYIYAILNCEAYTIKFEELLLHEFPRIMVIDDTYIFYFLAHLGIKIMALHLSIFSNEEMMKLEKKKFTCINLQNQNINQHPDNSGIDNSGIKLMKWVFKSEETINIPPNSNQSTNPLGNNTDQGEMINLNKNHKNKTIYEPHQQGIIHLWGNSPIKLDCSVEAWNYKIGSIKILEHWLKARRFSIIKRKITIEEINELVRTIFILERTIKFRKKIDAIISPIHKRRFI